MAMWKEAGIKVIPVVASVGLAKMMERAGADAVVHMAIFCKRFFKVLVFFAFDIPAALIYPIKGFSQFFI